MKSDGYKNFVGLRQLQPIDPSEVSSRVYTLCEVFDMSKNFPILFCQKRNRKMNGYWNIKSPEMMFYYKEEGVEWETVVHEFAHMLHQLCPKYNSNYVRGHNAKHIEIMKDVSQILMAEFKCVRCGNLFNSTFDFTKYPLQIPTHKECVNGKV